MLNMGAVAFSEELVAYLHGVTSNETVNITHCRRSLLSQYYEQMLISDFAMHFAFIWDIYVRNTIKSLMPES
jgi:hypothetical protein